MSELDFEHDFRLNARTASCSFDVFKVLKVAEPSDTVLVPTRLIDVNGYSSLLKFKIHDAKLEGLPHNALVGQSSNPPYLCYRKMTSKPRS